MNFRVVLHVEPHVAVPALVALRDGADCIHVAIFIGEGDDPFLGSGITALAAVRLRRQFLGIERNEEYMRLAESRITALSKERE